MKEDKSAYILAMVSKIICVIFTIFSTALINRSLGVSLKGDYAYIINIVSILYIILSLGIGITYVTYKKRSINKNCDIMNYFFSITFYQFIFSFVIGFLLCFFVNKYISYIVILSSSYILKGNLLAISAVEDVKIRDKRNIVFHFIYLIMVSLGYFLFKKNIDYMLLIYFIEALISSVGIVFTFKMRLVSIENILKNINIFELLKFGLMSMFMQLMINLNYNLDIIVLKRLTTSYYVGLYSVAVNLGNFLWLIPDAFKDVVFNKSSKKDNPREIALLIKFNVILSLFVTIAFVFVGKWFIKFFYGQDFVKSYLVTIILFFGCISMIIYKLIHPLYISNGKQKVVLLILSVSVMINVLLNYILIPRYNIYGAAFSSVISYTICSVIFLMCFSKKYNIKMRDIFIVNRSELKIIKNKILKNKSIKEGKNEK